MNRWERFLQWYYDEPIIKLVVYLIVADCIVGVIFQSIVAAMILNLILATFNLILSIINLRRASRNLRNIHSERGSNGSPDS